MKNQTIAIVLTAGVVIAGLIGFLVLSDGNQTAPNQTETETSQTNNTNTTGTESTANESELPAYLQAQGVNIRGTLDATGQSEVAVAVGDSFFDPTVLTVSRGTTVTWTNEGAMQHTVTSAEDSPQQGLDSELLAAGESYSYTFTETGAYNYFCEPHPITMKAVVNVVE